MVVLGIDTSAGLALGLIDSQSLSGIGEYWNPDARSHAELLSLKVRDLLAEHEKSLDDVVAIVVGRGPAPFTGLRAGLVSAQTLGFALSVPVIGVCSLAGIASGIATETGAELIITSDARRKELYWAHYGPQLGIVHGPAVNSPEEIAIYAATKELTVYGAAGQLYGEIFTDAGATLATGTVVPSGISLARLGWQEHLNGNENSLTPLYLRGPDAKVPTTRKQALQA